jgi:hypothetical protein
LVVVMAVSRQWLVDMLRHMGYEQAANDAAQELPDPLDAEQLTQFADRHGISRSEVVDRMGGSP